MKIFIEIRKLDCTKVSQDTDIPPSIIKEMLIFLQILLNHNKAVSDCEFPTSFKNANISSVCKKDSKLEEKNYRPISILPNLSKKYERIMYSLISTYLDIILSKYQYGYSSQQCLLVLIEQWKKRLDKGDKCGVLLTNLSEGF